VRTTTVPATSSNPVRLLIQRATGATDRDLDLIEDIMRDEIFHSTLDWQTREQLTAAARQAFDSLRDNREIYGAGRTAALAAFQSTHSKSL
jgi:hypothetical protein